MKICLSSTGKEMGSKLDPRFGRCRYFVLFNTESKDYRVIENSGFSSAHGAGVAAAQQIVNEDVDVIITGNLGPNAMNILSSANIKGFAGEVLSLKENIDQFQKDELNEITKSGKAHHGQL